MRRRPRPTCRGPRTGRTSCNRAAGEPSKLTAPSNSGEGDPECLADSAAGGYRLREVRPATCPELRRLLFQLGRKIPYQWVAVDKQCQQVTRRSGDAPEDPRVPILVSPTAATPPKGRATPPTQWPLCPIVLTAQLQESDVMWCCGADPYEFVVPRPLGRHRLLKVDYDDPSTGRCGLTVRTAPR
jgi:hypothetical protein